MQYKREKFTVLFDLLSPVYDVLIKWLCLLRGGCSYEEGIRRTIVKSLDVQSHHTLLDIGIGTGINLTYLQPLPMKVVGVDPAFGMLKQCDKQLIKLGIDGELFCHPAERLAFADDSFDRILCANVLMYASSHDLVVREMLRVLKPAGKLVLTVHSRWLTAQGPLCFQQEPDGLSITETKQGMSTIFLIQKGTLN